MALLSRLLAYASSAFGLPAPTEALPDGDEAHLAATALLVHIARADGVLDAAETERLARLVRGRYADSDAAARDLIARAAAFDAQTRDLTSLVELIGEDGAPEQREKLLAMAWAVAGADGAVHEFEEALVWRLGKLLGFDEAGIQAARPLAQSGGAAALA
ncbi:putative tellurite resistance protein B-like protein [Methylorubrum rhodinum]|uniref:Putative tellurite resistance protein B-like protein n=2 Tax=Methylorubrum rhodinum TaxID=29428 RepID=A0A840ZCP7_9HYPH|nr:TerB family tellurite resistance protein [Methylorubrum rhodinum]MBB5755652.1 putative tellurite resistance protein B-like protein [Methylorubrum rhodinum]